MEKGKKDSRFIYECAGCGKQYDPEEVLYLCPTCSHENKANTPPAGILKTLYDYHNLRKKGLEFNQLRKSSFKELLPIESLKSLPGLRIGNTPGYFFRHFGGKKLPFQLFFKDDGQNPTWSFKDRASAVVSAYAKEKGYETLVAASTGNAGSSLAGICASQGQKAVIMVPEKAPLAKLTQIIMYGAQIVPVKGTYDEAFELSIKATEAFGWYNRNTAYNPLTIEGKKTVAFELFEQLGEKVPDRVFVSVGDGVIISGVYKGFEDLFKLGLTDRMPVVVGVQSEGSDNLVRNLDLSVFEIKPGTTMADSISVDVPRNFLMARDYIHQYQGEAITVSDQEILDAAAILARNTGIFAEPAAAAAFAGLLHHQVNDLLPANSNNVVLLTGSGLKDLEAVKGSLIMPAAIAPDIDELKMLLPKHQTTR